MGIVFIRTIILYLAIIISLRILGKRQIGEMQPSELVITILISEVASIPMQNNSIPLVYGIISIFTLVSLELILSYASLKSTMLRNLLSGKPSLVILNGKIIQDELPRLRFSLDDLFEELRMQQIEKVSDISAGILETNGRFSISLKPDAKPPNRRDMDVHKENHGLIKNIIKKGEIEMKVVEGLGLNEIELYKLLNDSGLVAENLFYCTIDQRKNIFEYELIDKGAE